MTMKELMELPPAAFLVLHMIAFEQQQKQAENDKEAVEQAQAEAVEEVMEEGGLIP